MKTTSHLDMIATHLNAPYGDVVTVADLALALRAGSLADIQSDLGRALLMTIFIECAASIEKLSLLPEAKKQWDGIRAAARVSLSDAIEWARAEIESMEARER